MLTVHRERNTSATRQGGNIAAAYYNTSLRDIKRRAAHPVQSRSSPYVYVCICIYIYIHIHAYVYIYIYIYIDIHMYYIIIYIHTYIYIYIYIYYTHVYTNIYIYIYMYIHTCVWYNLLPLIRTPPLIRNLPLGGTNICYYQSIRRHDYPPHKKRCLVKPPPNTKKCGFVLDRRSIDVLTKCIRKASEITFLVKTPKSGSFVVDRNSIDLYYKVGGFVVDRKSIDLLTKYIRKASEMRLA